MAFYRGKEPSPLDDDPNSSAFQFSINPDGTDPRSQRKQEQGQPDLLSAAGAGDGLIEVGRHCSEPSCHQLDFLPHLCHKCSRYYCLDHFQLTRHTCTEPLEATNTMPTCPLCNKDIKVPRNASKDEYVDRHIASGCVEHLLDLTPAQKAARKQAWHCDAGFCSNVKDKLSTLTCPSCHGTYCLRHRFPSDHRCGDQQRERAEKARIARLGAVERRRAASAAPAAASADEESSGGFFAGVRSASASLLEKLRLKREARSSTAAAKASSAKGTGTDGSAGQHGPPASKATTLAHPSSAGAPSSSLSPSTAAANSSGGGGVPNSSRPILASPHLSSATPPSGVSPRSSPVLSPAAGTGGSNGQGGVWSLGPSPPPSSSPMAGTHAAATASSAAPAKATGSALPGPAAYLPAPFGRFGARATGSTLRQLQSSAKGEPSVPPEQRVCLRVRFPATAPPGARLPPALVKAGGIAVVWVDKRWTVGRALDSISRIVGIPLTNHLKDKPQAQLAPAAAPGSGFGHGEKLTELEAAREGADVAFGWVLVPGRA